MTTRMTRFWTTSLALAVAAAVPLAAQGRVAGVVYDSLRTRAPLAGARVVLDGTALEAVTDQRGRFSIVDVPAGTHLITFFHPLLDSLQFSAPAYRIPVGPSGMSDVRLAVPSFGTLSRYLCGSALDSTRTILFGTVRSAEDRQPIAGATSEVRWFEFGLGGGARLQRVDRMVSDTSDASGSFLLCGVPNDIEISFRFVSGGQATGPLDLDLGSTPVAFLEPLISLRDSAAALRTDSEESLQLIADTVDASVPVLPGSADLLVQVQDRSGRPVRGATVGLRGTPYFATTDTSGLARLRGIAAGSHTVAVRAIGKAPLSEVVHLVPSQENRATLRMPTVEALLPEVRVSGLKPDALMESIERRKRAGNGLVLDAKKIEASGGGSNALYAVPSLVMQRNTFLGGKGLPFFRSGNGMPCTPVILVDGIPRARIDAWELDNLMKQAHHVEIYSRSMLIPAELVAMNACGAIAIWIQ